MLVASGTQRDVIVTRMAEIGGSVADLHPHADPESSAEVFSPQKGVPRAASAATAGQPGGEMAVLLRQCAEMERSATDLLRTVVPLALPRSPSRGSTATLGETFISSPPSAGALQSLGRNASDTFSDSRVDQRRSPGRVASSTINANVPPAAEIRAASPLPRPKGAHVVVLQDDGELSGDGAEAADEGGIPAMEDSPRRATSAPVSSLAGPVAAAQTLLQLLASMTVQAAKRNGGEEAAEILSSIAGGPQSDRGAQDALDALRAAVVRPSDTQASEQGVEQASVGDDDFTAIRAERDRYRQELADSHKEVAALLASHQELLSSLQDRIGPVR
mmetsp:Transcript_83207/g.222391  ORF Transcript_83207/g.222391 Transcript_83207/m.222391 type:complete len:332 (-) Transcript_83207:75-1070(-)